MATATETKSSEQLIAEFKAAGASLNEIASQLKTLGKPVHLNGGQGAGALSYWDGDGETVMLENSILSPKAETKAMAASRKGRLTLPKGYDSRVFKSSGDWLTQGYRAARENNFGEYTAKNNGVFKAVQGMSVQDGQSAGYFVLPEFNQQILERIYSNDIWARTDQYTVNNNMVFLANAETSRATGSRHGGLKGVWVDEATSLTKSKPTFRRIELNLKKLAVLVYLTDELIADGGAVLEQYVARVVGEEFNFLLGDSVFNGSGVQQPLGFINAPCLLSIAKETGQAATTIVTENVDKMWARRFANNTADYVWYHNQDCGPQLDRLTQDVGTGGVALYRDADGIAKAMPQTLKGAPRVEVEFAQTLGTAGDINLADLSQFITISKGGINQAYSTHVEFLTDQTAIRFTMRVNGRPWEAAAVTPKNGTNTWSSFIDLAAR